MNCDVRHIVAGVLAGAIVMGGAGVLSGAERHVMPPRVPDGKLAEARTLTNPVPGSPEIVAQGKALYGGKGGCVACHGTTGRGDGPAAANLNPSPRNFHHHGFWRHRTEGEIFWVIKHGSPGTAMIGFGSQSFDYPALPGGACSGLTLSGALRQAQGAPSESRGACDPALPSGAWTPSKRQLTDEEIWTVIRYLRTFAGGHGPRGGMGRRGPRDGGGECCA